MSNPNPNNTELEQQQSKSEVASLENQVEGNYSDKLKSEAQAADGIAKNLEQAEDKK
ncbi:MULTISPECIES: hypothetical protein [Psychrobacter]|uniref:hypothetical protein n=1 Tax=Psychrobacter TaxID=497 RepID=UPI00146A1F47|nr:MULTISPECIES: hypothetical protein [Psychrobacter]